MIRIAFGLLALIALATPARAVDRPYPVSDFNRLVVEGPYRVRLVVGGASAAVASGTRDGLDRVSIESAGQTLRIRPRRHLWGAAAGTDPGPVTIELRTRVLRSARLIGPAVLEVEGAGTTELNLDLMVEGSGTLRATRVAADHLALGLLGAGTLEVAGAAKSLRGQFQGTGNVAAANLAADSATITTNTVGTVTLRVNGRAEITAHGLGTVTIGGSPACVLSGSGSANVRCGGASDQSQPR